MECSLSKNYRQIRKINTLIEQDSETENKEFQISIDHWQNHSTGIYSLDSNRIEVQRNRHDSTGPTSNKLITDYP